MSCVKASLKAGLSLCLMDLHCFQGGVRNHNGMQGIPI